MQSQRKHKQPKKERVNASEFAKQYLMNVGDVGKALANVKNLETAARGRAEDKTLSSSDQKHYIKLVNFWANVAGHINKFDRERNAHRKAI